MGTKIFYNEPLTKAYHSRQLGWCSYIAAALFDSYDITQRLQLNRILSVHNGCVNTISWSENGQWLLSGGDDNFLVVSDVFDHIEPVKYRFQSGHQSNIFSARFLPGNNSSLIVSCASDGSIIVTDLNRPDTYGKNKLLCHTGVTYEVAVVADDPHTFLSCGDDCCVRCYDTREKTSCSPCRQDIIVEGKSLTSAIDVNPVRTWSLAVGCADSLVRVYDLRKLSKPSQDSTGILGLSSLCCLPTTVAGSNRPKKVTSVDFSKNGSELLVSFSADDVFVYSTQQTVEVKTDIGRLQDGEAHVPRRVRLRGDWSDTGPATDVDQLGIGANAASANDLDTVQDEENMSRMASRFRSFLNNWLDTNLTRNISGAASQTESQNFSSEPNAESNHQQEDDRASNEALVSSEVPNEIGQDLASNQTVVSGGQHEHMENLTKFAPKSSVERIREIGINRKRLYQRLLQLVPQNLCLQSFKGHRNARTMLKQACFWGRNHVMSGSDCGHVLVWRRDSTAATAALPADQHVVNCVQPHPFMPILATSGIDYDIKLWIAGGHKMHVDETFLDALVKRNERMLAETRDTVTIPASFLIRLIARLNRRQRQQRETDVSSDEEAQNDERPDEN